MKWFQKHKALKITVLAVIVLAAAFVLWYTQPQPLIPDGAKNVEIQITEVTDEARGLKNAPMKISFQAGDYEGAPTDLPRYVMLSDEGAAELIKALEKLKVRASLAKRSRGSAMRFDYAFSFALGFEYKDVKYTVWLYGWDGIELYYYIMQADKSAPLRPMRGVRYVITDGSAAGQAGAEFFRTLREIGVKYGTPVTGASQ